VVYGARGAALPAVPAACWRRITLLALFASGVISAGTAAGGPACSGRYVVTSASGRLLRAAGAIAFDAMVVDAGRVTLASPCTSPPATTRVGKRLVASWQACDGHRRVRLHARVADDCSFLHGVVSARGEGRTRFGATASRCGDGILDAGNREQCDDGNTLGGDPCEPDCSPCDPTPGPFESSWLAIETNVVARYGCANCHGSLGVSGLDLRPGGTYERLVGGGSQSDPGRLLVQPGAPMASVLWRKLAKGVDQATYDLVPGGGMPANGRVSAAELGAVGAWITGGAPRDGVVAGTESLLSRCPPRL